MLRLNIAQLPLHEQKLYNLIITMTGAAFVLGLLWVLLGFSDQASPSETGWQQTTLSTSDDPLAQYNVVVERPRWFVEKATGRAKKANEQLKALEGSPESLRLIGLVTQSDKRYALFLPVIAANAKVRPIVQQLSEGQILVGEWIIKSISNREVIIAKGDATQSLKMYQPGAVTNHSR